MIEKNKKIARTKIFLISFSLLIGAGLIGGALVYSTIAATMCSHGLYCVGGKVNKVDRTRCCNGWKVEVGDPRGGTYMFTPGFSKLYMWNRLEQDEWVLGDAYPFGVCVLVASWPPCSDTENVDGTIRQLGTSAINGGGGGGGGFGGGGASGGY